MDGCRLEGNIHLVRLEGALILFEFKLPSEAEKGSLK